MNWSYLGTAALLPLAVALGLTLLAGAVQAVRLNRQGGASGAALRRLLRTLALVFPLAFLATSLWDGRRTWRGLAGVALGRPADQRVLGQLRISGEGFLARDPAQAVPWFRKAAEHGDGPAQYLLAWSLASGTGTPRNPAEALRWAGAAGSQGHVEAMILAGDLNRSAQPDEASAWYRKAMAGLAPRLERREPQACLLYGSLLSTGKGASADPVEGLAWMKVAERRGLPKLQTVMVRIAETRVLPDQRAAAERRAEDLVTGR